jgi:anti-sigma B factor antagonist
LAAVGVSGVKDVFAGRDAGIRSFPLSDDLHLLAPAGELDLYVAPDFRRTVLEVVAGGVDRVIVDLFDVTFVDSTALGVFVDVAKRLRGRGGSLTVVCRDRNILRVLEITGLSRLFRVCESIPEAIATRGHTARPRLEAV